ncbi:MAG: beta-N-acetylhexosaminidase [Tannerella sp.]|jgi:hypothetical protein|nr:beta-N-acetylhexosaminidase [Tannerella sp.]
MAIKKRIQITMLFFSCLFVNAQQINLIPEPVSLTATEGTFSLNGELTVVAARNLQSQAAFLKEMLQNEAGINISSGKAPKNQRIIKLEINGKLQLPEEGYSLSVAPQAVTISAPEVKGIFYGVQSLRQLITETGEIPCVKIEDYPRFGWRGLMLDASRTFLPVNLLKRYIDLMALYKLNTLHWHLTDDQGWRIEIKKYPLLTQIGSKFRAEDNVMGGYYSQEEIKDVVRYAAERNITIVPEIEMPGHSMATIVSYPELTCPVVDKKTLEVHEFFKGKNIHPEILCAGNEAVYEFMDNVLEEVCALFPSQYVHIGGDEAPKQFWKECPLCQKVIAENNLENENALQGYFVERILKMLEIRGKMLIGWDEILADSKLPSHVVGMYWRDRENNGMKRFLKEGHKMIATPRRPLYFDYDYKTNPSKNVYEYDPSANLTPEEAANVLGVQANFWSHIEHSEARIDRQLFPRLLALAAAAWTPVTQKNWQQFQPKLESHYKRLEQMHIDYYKPELQAVTEKKVEEFPIMAWIGVPEEETSVARFRELKESGININFSNYSSMEAVLKALDTAQRAGVKLMPFCPELKDTPEETVRKLMGHPALAGYHLRDEPNAKEFEELAVWTRRIQAVDAVKPCYINLFPNFASPTQYLGAQNYEVYVDSFLNTIPVPFISFDIYPVIEENGVRSLRPEWYDNLELISSVAKARNLPFWAFALSVEHGASKRYPLPTAAEIRLQMFSNLAYGAQTLQYFTYWTPWKGNIAPISDGGKRSAVYDIIKEVNAEIHAFAGVFHGAKMLDVWHTGKEIPAKTKRLATLPEPLTSLDTGDGGAIVSLLENGVNRYLVVVNRDFQQYMSLNITFGKPVKQVQNDGKVTDVSQKLLVAPGDVAIFTWEK